MGMRSEPMNQLVTRVGAATAMALLLLAIGGVAARVDAGSPQGGGAPSPDQAGAAKAKGGAASKSSPAKVGLSINDPRAFPGYTLLAPLTSKTTYLIDLQ